MKAYDDSVIYKNIRFYRELRKMSLEELAEKSGYTSRSVMSRVERGTVDIPVTRLVKIASALNVDVATLMGFEDKVK